MPGILGNFLVVANYIFEFKSYGLGEFLGLSTNNPTGGLKRCDEYESSAFHGDNFRLLYFGDLAGGFTVKSILYIGF